MENLIASNSLVWPLCFLLVALMVLKKLGDDVRPIVRGIVIGLSTKAQSNAVQWATLIAVATLGSMDALKDVARANGWVFVEAFAHIASPFIATFAGARVLASQQAQTGGPTTVSLPQTNQTSKVTIEQQTTETKT
jgi:hypothetical protein